MSEPPAAKYRAGVVALLGRPNSGKSTLLNRLLGEKLAIVTAKPQTTRSRILGILTRETAQLLLLDTPGLHDSTRTFNAALNEQVDEALADCDVAVILVDAARGWEALHDSMLERLRARHTPVLVAATKSDLPLAKQAPWPPEPLLHHLADDATPLVALRISALTGAGIDTLLQALEERLPVSPPLYPEDEISDRPLRFLAAELVREAAFEELSQELPYALAVEVIEFDESRDDLIRIRANLIVTRSSQKQIVIGKGGAMIKRSGTRARKEIEKLVGNRVHLELWTTVEPKWSKRPNRRKALGYS